MSDVALHVRGLRYEGFKSVRITRSIETVAGSFDLEVVDRWYGQDEGWVIDVEDQCQVAIDDEVVIKGYIDKRSPSFSGTSRRMAYSGRDLTASIVDSSAVLAKWSYKNQRLGPLLTTLADGLVKVIGDGDLYGLDVPGKIAINPGERVFEIMLRVARMVGVLLVTDGPNGIVRIARAGETRSSDAIVEGENMVSGDAAYDYTRRYRNYIVLTQQAGSDNTNGTAALVKAQSADDGVSRDERVLLLRPEQGMPTEYAQNRADWEARIRAAKSERASATVQGWRRSDGTLWTVNELAYVKSPTLGIDGQMLISSVEFSLGQGGEITRLSLVRPDAFTPAPTKGVRESEGGKWKKPAGST